MALARSGARSLAYAADGVWCIGKDADGCSDVPRSRVRSRTPQMARCMHKDRLGDKIDVVLRSLKEVPRRVGRGAVFNCCLINSN